MNKPSIDRQRLVNLERELSIAEDQLQLISKNLARASDERVFAIVRAEFESQESHVQDLKEQIIAGQMSAREATRFDPTSEVEKALELFDRMELIATNETARPYLRTLLNDIGFQIGLYFGAGVKGTKRKDRILQSGIVTMGEKPLPVKPYGKDYIAPMSEGGNKTSVAVSRPNRFQLAEQRNPQEGVSFTKVNRGD